MAGEPRYAALITPVSLGGAVVCEDCGVIVADRKAHTRSHSIQSGVAWLLAILKTSHLSALAHDRYDVAERAARRKFDSWSGEALAEVLDGLPGGGP